MDTNNQEFDEDEEVQEIPVRKKKKKKEKKCHILYKGIGKNSSFCSTCYLTSLSPLSRGSYSFIRSDIYSL